MIEEINSCLKTLTLLALFNFFISMWETFHSRTPSYLIPQKLELFLYTDGSFLSAKQTWKSL